MEKARAMARALLATLLSSEMQRNDEIERGLVTEAESQARLVELGRLITARPGCSYFSFLFISAWKRERAISAAS